MYLFLAAVILLGLWNTVASNILGHFDYRESISVWFRGIFFLDPRPELMAEAPLGFQVHAVLALLLFALWPFTRLVHVFSAPLGYLTRPYIVYRSRDVQLGSRAPRRGWERVG
jgi:nitrate reductase gamma subunit